MLPEGQGHHINMCQLPWALDVLILERKGNRNIRRKILLAQERSTIDTQLTQENHTRHGFSSERHNAIQGWTIFI